MSVALHVLFVWHTTPCMFFRLQSVVLGLSLLVCPIGDRRSAHEAASSVFLHFLGLIKGRS